MSWDRSGKGGFQYVGFMMGNAVLWRGDMGHSTNLSLVTSDLTDLLAPGFHKWLGIKGFGLETRQAPDWSMTHSQRMMLVGSE